MTRVYAISGIILISVLMFAIPVYADTLQGDHSKQNAYRNLWDPNYLGQRLAYCSFGGKECGLPVACQYCRMLGYDFADQAIIAHNVGLTNYISSRERCKGWRCNGFSKIRCVKKIIHKPIKEYYYRSRHYVFPRWDNYRVDWCYEDNKECGQRVAHSFCRRVGYSYATSYKKECHLNATKALGNHQLCFGPNCQGFLYIDCYR